MTPTEQTEDTNKMVCSICGAKGHNRTRCTSQAAPATDFVLSSDVLERFRVLVEICREVSRVLGKGYTEGVYQQALCIELQSRNIPFGIELPMPLVYKGKTVPYHTHRLDIMLYDWLPFIFELKATGTPIKNVEHWQLMRYMITQNVPYGAVVNFTQALDGEMEMTFLVLHDGKKLVYDWETGSAAEMEDYSGARG